MINFLYLFIAFVVDIFLGIIFPTSFVGFNISATPSVLLITLILITYKEDVFKSLLFGFFVGLFIDIFNTDTVFTYAIIYMLTTWVVSAWSTRINDTFVELFLVTLAAVFLKEFLVYLANVSFSSHILKIGTWGAKHLVFTILFALAPIVIAVLIKLDIIEKKVREQQVNREW